MRTKRKKGKAKPAAFPLKALLALKGWSQRKLAMASGIDMASINSLANGRSQPTWPTILRIATTVGADLGDLQPKGGAA